MWLIFFLNMFPLLSAFPCLKNVAVQLSVHNAIKDADLSGPMFADSRPDVDFEEVLGLEVPLCQFTNLSVTSAPPLLKGHGTFVAENNVMESVATLNVSSGCLILLSHLMFDERFHFNWKLPWPFRSVKALCGSSVLNLFLWATTIRSQPRNNLTGIQLI